MPIIQRANSAGALASLVAIDAATGGFVQDSEVSTFARTFLDDTSARSVAATLGLWYPEFVGTNITAPTDTNENTLASGTLTGGSMGPNGILRVRLQLTPVNNGNAKAIRFKLGATELANFSIASIAGGVRDIMIFNINAQNSQVVQQLATIGGYGTMGAAATAAVDTSGNLTWTITCQKATGSDSVVLNDYLIEYLYRA